MGLERMQNNDEFGFNYALNKKQELIKNLDQPLWSGEFMKDILCHFTKEEVVRWGNPDFLKTIPESCKKYFDGYIAYYFPDGRKKCLLWEQKTIVYGIGVATKEGVNHVHFESPAFNYVISGTGVFTGYGGIFNGKTIRPSKYSGDNLQPGKGYEVLAGMPHGHKVIDGPIVFFFVQGCGFHLIEGYNENPCLGDFYRVGGDISDVQQQISS